MFFGCGLSAVTFLLQPLHNLVILARSSTWAMLSLPLFASRHQSSSGFVVEVTQQQDYFLTRNGWLHLEAIQINILSCKELYEHLHGRD